MGDQHVAALRDRLSDGAVTTDTATIAPFLTDERRLFTGAALCLVRPGSLDDVVALLTYCDHHRIGVVPQGGNTGYSGAATPLDAAHVLVRMDRLNRVRHVNADNLSMTVEAGVAISEAHAAAEAVGLQFPLTMGSIGSAQVGGAISTNAGGTNVLRYGMTRDLVLGLEAVLPGGRVLKRATGLRKDNSGIRVADLLIGAEGTLGIVTAATVKLFPALPGRATALLEVPSVRIAASLLREFRIACDDNLVAFELITPQAAALSTTPIAGLDEPPEVPRNHPLVLAEVAANTDDHAQDLLDHAVETAIAEGHVYDGSIARSSEQRRAMWRFRETIPEGERRLASSLGHDSIKHDISVPVDQIADFVETAMTEVDLLTDGAVRWSIFGHLGDGNLHFNAIPTSATLDRDAVSRVVSDLAESVGGSFSAEHGIGALKRDDLARYRADELDLMRAVKAVYDPHGIMNPGKVV